MIKSSRKRPLSFPDKVLYWAPLELSLPEHAGLRKKINGQIQGWQKLGSSVTLISFENFKLTVSGTPLPYSIPYYFMFYLGSYLYLIWHLISTKENYDVLYLRAATTPPQLYLSLFFLSLFSSKNPLVILETPTPQRDKERHGIKQKLLTATDRYIEPLLLKLIDAELQYGAYQGQEHHEKFISVSNGIEVGPFLHPRAGSASPQDGSLNCIAIGNLSKTQAFDRMIIGLHQYYSIKPLTNIIQLAIIGTGSELENLKELASSGPAQKYILFPGYQVGKDLDSWYDWANLGISTLGFHRIGLHQGSELKAREYTARGLPFIAATPDPSFQNSDWFRTEVKTDDSPIDCHFILRFAHQVFQRPSYQEAIQHYANTNLSWESTIEKDWYRIVELVNKNDKNPL